MCLFVFDFVYAFFFPLAARLIGPRTGCQFFKKNFNFSVEYPLNSVFYFFTVCVPRILEKAIPWSNSLCNISAYLWIYSYNYQRQHLHVCHKDCFAKQCSEAHLRSHQMYGCHL